MILFENNLDVSTSAKEKYELIIEASKGSAKFEQIRDWLKLRLIKNVP